MIRDLYAHMPTPNYVEHLSSTVDAIEKYAISTMYQFPSDPTVLAQHLKKHSDNKLEKRNSLTPLMQIKLPVPEKRPKSINPTMCSYPVLFSPYQTQSHNAHPPSQESHLPTPALQKPSFDVFRSTTGHETSNVPDAAGTKCNVAKYHEQHVANAAWSEDLPSNTTFPVKLSSPISPNCMFSFLFMNIAHLYAKYRQKATF